MRKIIILTLFIIHFLLFTASAQVPELWGIAQNPGNTNSSGIFFKIFGDGSGFTNLYQCVTATGASPRGKFSIYNNNGQLYGTNFLGGLNNTGVLFSYDTLTNTYIELYDFINDTIGIYPNNILLLASNNKFYGNSVNGSKGIIFCFDPSINNISIVDSTRKMETNFTQGANGLLYGIGQGGQYNNGTIMSLDIINGNIDTFYSFPPNNIIGSFAGGGLNNLLQATNGLLYGTVEMDSSMKGYIYSYNITTNTFTHLIVFQNNDTLGGTPFGSLIQATNGLLYGMTSAGGDHNAGVIFSIDPITSIYHKIFDFNGTTGSGPVASLIQASDGKLYGTTRGGGAHLLGVVFSYDIVTNTYTDIHDFNNPNGESPWGDLIEMIQCIVPTIVTSGNISICNGDSILLTANGANHYWWADNNIYDSLIMVSPTVTTTYHILGSNQSCFASDSITVTVNQNPIPIIIGDSVFCSGNTTTLSTGSYATYNWNNGSTNQTAIVDSANTYTVTVTNAYGCTGTASKIVTMNQSPVSSFSGSSSFCSGSSLVINAGTFSQYLWSNGDTTQTITVTSATTYTVTVTAANGCTGTASETVTLFPSPTPSITGVSSFCPGDSTTLSTGSFVEYLWSTGSSNQTITVTTPNTYIVTVTDANGCSGIASETVTLIPPVNVQSAFNADTVKGCSPFTVQFQNTSINGTSYLWNFGDGSTDTSTNPIHTFTDSGTYTITLIATNVGPCGTVSDTTIQANYISVNVFKPVAAFTSNYVIPIYTGDSILFENQSYDPTLGTITLWQWWFGDGTGSNFLNPAHEWNVPGLYQVELIVTDNKGCKDSTIYDYIDVIEGIIEIPNIFSPNNDGYNDFFEIKASGIQTFQLDIFNRWGMKLFTSFNINISWDGYNQSGMQCPDGTYYFVLKAMGYTGTAYNRAGFVMLIR